MSIPYAACCQVDNPNPGHRDEMARNTSAMLAQLERAVVGYRPFHDIRLVVFPEFAHAAPIHPTAEEIAEKLAVEIPNPHTERLEAAAREHGVWIQSGSFLEVDPKYPDAVFNTTVLIGPDGIASKYRKVNPWIPWEVHASPCDIPGYEEELFPVVETDIGRLGVATCYDWLFPEVTRELTLAGAEVLIRISAYMDPWGSTPPDRLVDGGEPLSRPREHGHGRRLQSGSERGPLSPLLLARLQHDRRPRRADRLPGAPGAGRGGGGRPHRDRRPPRGAEPTERACHATPPASRGVPPGARRGPRARSDRGRPVDRGPRGADPPQRRSPRMVSPRAWGATEPPPGHGDRWIAFLPPPPSLPCRVFPPRRARGELVPGAHR